MTGDDDGNEDGKDVSSEEKIEKSECPPMVVESGSAPEERENSNGP